MFDNKHANQGSRCSSVPTYTLVMHNIALYHLGGAQDNFACMLSTFFMVYISVLSVSLCVLTIDLLAFQVEQFTIDIMSGMHRCLVCGYDKLTN